MSAIRLRWSVAAGVASILLTGCHGNFFVQAGGGASSSTQVAPGASVTRSQVSFGADSALGAAVLIGIMAADGLRTDQGSPGGGTARIEDMPSSGMGRRELDPSRRIRVQDCSRPVDLDGGNLVCR